MDNFEYVLIEKFSEILSRYSNMNIVVNLNGNANSVTFSDTEASGKDYVVLNVMLRNSGLKHFYYGFRALEMAGGTNTNLYYKHKLYLCQNLVCEKLAYGFGTYGMKRLVNLNANALLTVTKSESTAKINLITKVIICN